MDALYHPFLEDGRIRYHTFLCSCCVTGPVGGRQFVADLEPSVSNLFDFSYEKELFSIPKAKGIYFVNTNIMLAVVLCVGPIFSLWTVKTLAGLFK